MKILIFSDTHLTKNFEPRKFQYLKKIISKADKVIINGDFWDGYSIKFDQFISSKWKKLFPILKSKNTIYIYGNHDEPEKSDKRVNLFSDKAVNHYSLSIDDEEYHFIHGHSILKTIGMRYPFLAKPFFNYLSTRYFKFSSAIFKDKFWRKKRYYKCNNIIYRLMLEKGWDYLFAGHVHLQQNIDNRFFNPGILNHGLAQYIVIDTKKSRKDRIRLFNNRY